MPILGPQSPTLLHLEVVLKFQRVRQVIRHAMAGERGNDITLF